MLDRPHPIAVLISAASPCHLHQRRAGPLCLRYRTGNALIDDFMRARNGCARDENGGAAARGRVDETAVARVHRHSFFALKPPKSLDRNAFREWVADRAQLADKSLEDGAATLAAITAASVATIVAHLPETPRTGSSAAVAQATRP